MDAPSLAMDILSLIVVGIVFCAAILIVVAKWVEKRFEAHIFHLSRIADETTKAVAVLEALTDEQRRAHGVG